MSRSDTSTASAVQSFHGALIRLHMDVSLCFCKGISVVVYGRNWEHRASILTNHLLLSNYLFRKQSKAVAASFPANAEFLKRGSWALCG